MVVGRGAFEYWESGMDVPLGRDRYESFVRYQSRVIQALDEMAEPYGFATIDAARSPEQIFRERRRSIKRIISRKKPRGDSTSLATA